jgi:hypothetical protein
MALDNPGDLLADAAVPQKVGTLLRMHDGMGQPPADVVEHRAFPYQVNTYKDIEHCVSERNVPHCPAVGNYLFAASCFMQQIFTGLIRLVRHDPVTF